MRTILDPSRPRRLAAPLTLLSLAALTACGGGGGGGGGGGDTPGMSGTLSVFLPNQTTLEAEPNDTLAQAHQLGTLSVGAELSVLGTITESGADQIDVFELAAPTRVLVDLTLTGISTSADLDIYVYDAVSLQVVQSYTTPAASESGTFAAQGTFFVVVDAFSGDSDYELTVSARAIGASIPEIEPNDSPQDGSYLGTIAAGQSLIASGDGLDADSDFFLFSIPSGQSVQFLLTTAAGNDYDVNVYDATSDLANPTLLATFNASGNTESGSVPVTPMTLYALEVFPFQGASAPYTLEIATTVSFPVGRLAQPEPPGRRATRATIASVTRDPDALLSVTEVPFRATRGSLIVRYQDGVARRTESALEAAAAVVAEIPGGPRRLALDLPAGLDDVEAARLMLAVAATLRAREDVVFAELDPWMTASALPQTEVRPNDPFYNLQWHYEQIGLPAAWATTTGDSAVRVAILDTGSAPATDLIDVGGIDMISDPAIAGDGDGVDNDPTDVGDGLGSPQPSSFHGAHVAGTVSARTNNGFGVAGVAWESTIVHVRVLGIGGGSSFDIANGVLWAAGLSNSTGQVANPRVDIINMSLGGAGFSQTFQNAVSAAHAAGVVVIAAAGNENSSTPSFPAAYDDVISVAAVDFERRRAPYSNFHPTVDIAAPGGDVTVDRNGDGYADGVLSTKPDDSVSPTNFDTFSFYQGTSMAAPHVAGVAVLLLSVDPTLTPDQVETILRGTATDLGAPGRDDQYGDGLVNAAAAVQMAAGGAGGPVLALDTGTVLLDVGTSSRRVGVSNTGSGTLEVTSVTATTATGGPWLSATRVPTGLGGPSNTSAIDIDVNRAGLANGTYGGSVVVASSGGSRTLAVTLVVGQATGPAVNYEVFVIAVDADTFETMAQDVVMTSGPLGYSLDGLPAGRYILVAGTDEDGDDFICDEGEPLCGLYPSLELASIIELAEGERITGLNFPLESPSGLSMASTGGGFRLLTARATR